MRYLVDTVALVRHFTRNPNIGMQARTVFREIETNKDTIIVSVVSLMEILYLSEKGRINVDLSNTLERVRSSSVYDIINLTPDILLVAKTVEFYELHDRLILATAKYLGVPVISSDSRFSEIADIRTIWD